MQLWTVYQTLRYTNNPPPAVVFPRLGKAFARIGLGMVIGRHPCAVGRIGHGQEKEVADLHGGEREAEAASLVWEKQVLSVQEVPL